MEIVSIPFSYDNKTSIPQQQIRLEIRERDHNPSHAHLVGGEYDVVIILETLESEGEWPKGLKDEVLSWIKRNQKNLMEEWKKWHK